MLRAQNHYLRILPEAGSRKGYVRYWKRRGSENLEELFWVLIAASVRRNDMMGVSGNRQNWQQGFFQKSVLYKEVYNENNSGTWLADPFFGDMSGFGDGLFSS